MIAAGLQKNSLIDYPGKLSCVIFLSGCNFTCPYCHNPELARGHYPQQIPLAQVTAFLKERRHLIDGVVITGGEPTLHADLAHWCRTIRQMGFAVKLDTNGSRPRTLSDLIQAQLIDFIAMDLKTALEAYGPPLCKAPMQAKIAQSIHLIMSSGLAYEFRTTCVPPFVDEALMARMAQAIQGARQYTLQAFQATSLLDPDYFKGDPVKMTPDTIQRLQAIAAPYVARCDIR